MIRIPEATPVTITLRQDNIFHNTHTSLVVRRLSFDKHRSLSVPSTNFFLHHPFVQTEYTTHDWQYTDGLQGVYKRLSLFGGEKEAIIGDISDEIYASIDRKIADTEPLMLEYTEDKDYRMPTGRYDVYAQVAGVFYVYDSDETLLFREIISYMPEKITVDIKEDYMIRMSGFNSVMIEPIETEMKNELNPGIWEVGVDIEPGNYTFSSDYGLGYLQLFESGKEPRVFEVISSENVQSKSTIQLEEGQKLRINGVTINFEKK